MYAGAGRTRSAGTLGAREKVFFFFIFIFIFFSSSEFPFYIPIQPSIHIHILVSPLSAILVPVHDHVHVLKTQYRQHQQQQQPPTYTDRPAHVFNGSTYPAYPPASSATTTTTADKRAAEDDTPNHSSHHQQQFKDLPEGKRRKFILVEDPQRSCRVRVKVMLDQVDMKEIPDSYRKANSVFPRTYVPVHSPFAHHRRKGDRFMNDDDESQPAGRLVAGSSSADADEDVTAGKTSVPMAMLEGEEVLVPRLTRAKKEREELLNDMGYRMSWGQSRVFAGRMLFLQRSMDAYRNKMRNSMLTAGHETSEIAPYFETRVGKRRWLDRGRKADAKDKDSTAATTAVSAVSAASPPAVLTTASSRSAEEVE
ncbi:hypothetical protein TRV_06495 [Trichophyton verrucosum HKI 0517]|uniref:Uncharacterized protein n=1 Tax=Trichophyton verrucosum (strain HKI 0517) TaxID=663202 RepID=D4DH40_TRIVH|nr:uncharacterized protein TRV_06495 [Trichophyton verrucosum HKI 0517]EFE38835.1 hypothetical protein TRV_06495 [Trichophyton verrucosum HKI 0517]